MKLTDVTRQQAGECADALRKLMAVPLVDEDGDSILSVRDQFALSDLLTACEDAERGARTPSPTARVEVS